MFARCDAPVLSTAHILVTGLLVARSLPAYHPLVHVQSRCQVQGFPIFSCLCHAPRTPEVEACVSATVSAWRYRTCLAPAWRPFLWGPMQERMLRIAFSEVTVRKAARRMKETCNGVLPIRYTCTSCKLIGRSDARRLGPVQSSSTCPPVQYSAGPVPIALVTLSLVTCTSETGQPL